MGVDHRSVELKVQSATRLRIIFACAVGAVGFAAANFAFGQPYALESLSLLPVLIVSLALLQLGRLKAATRVLVWGFVAWNLLATIPQGTEVMLLSPILAGTVLAGALLDARACIVAALLAAAGLAVSAHWVGSPSLIPATAPAWFWVVGAVPQLGLIAVSLAFVTSGRQQLEAATAAARAELEESERHWRALLTNAPSFILSVRADGTIDFINRAFTGSPSDIIGKRITDFAPPEFADAATEFIIAARATTEPLEQELMLTNTDGMKRQWHGVAAWIPASDHVVLVATDITERKRLEEGERRHTGNLARLASTALALLELPLDGNLNALVATELQALLRVPATVAVATCVDGLGLVGSEVRLEDGRELSAKIRDALAQPVPLTEELRVLLDAGEHRRYAHDDHSLSCELTRELVEEFAEHHGPCDVHVVGLSEEGVAIGAASFLCPKGTAIDAPLIEAFAGQAVAALSRRAAEHRLALAQAELRQVQKLEAIGRLAGGVAHDYNNALSAILGYAELIRTMTDDPMVADDAAQIVTVTEYAATLPRQLLAFSRRQSADSKPLNLTERVRSIGAILRRMVGESIELELDLDEDVDSVLLDEGQLEQVVLNLALNACDAMPNGGRLTIVTRNASPMRGQVSLQVRDTGEGIDPGTRAQIFEPFFTTKGEMGTGLGLSTVYGIVTQSGGEIEVESVVGVGTTSSVTFKTWAGTVEPPTAASTAPSSTGATILLAEDERSLRRVLQRILERAGHTVLAGADATEALALLEGHAGRIDLLLTDVMMPGRSGVELAAEVQARRPETPVLFMTGYSEEAVIEKDAMAAGRVMAKPFAPSELLARVAQLTCVRARQTILLVDEQAVVRRNCRRAMEAAEFAVVDFATFDEAALDLPVEVALIIADGQIETSEGEAVLARLRERSSELPLVVVAAQPPSSLPTQATFLLKPIGSNDLVAAVNGLLGRADLAE